MKKYFCDLHVHIGRTSEDKPVKITAARTLTFENIIREALLRKGMDVIGIVDCASRGVIRDIERLLKSGELMEMPEGGFLHRDRVAVIAGAEVETLEEERGSAHHIAFFPFLRQIKEFSRMMERYISNIDLSSQRCTLKTEELLGVVTATGGIFVPAHAFTPHKGLYGNVCRRLAEVFSSGENRESIFALELGLSADTDIADCIEELRDVTFLSNSDAHSLPKIGREYQIIEMERANFREMVLALKRLGNRGVVANIGLDPKLGRYHRTLCLNCGAIMETPPPVFECSKCGRSAKKAVVMGVLDRVVSIQDFPEPLHPVHRPPYHYQIPLQFVPGMTAAALDRLINEIGSEMAVLNTAEREDLTRVVGWEIASRIMLAREGKVRLSSGGGGKYGKVAGVSEKHDQLGLGI